MLVLRDWLRTPNTAFTTPKPRLIWVRARARVGRDLVSSSWPRTFEVSLPKGLRISFGMGIAGNILWRRNGVLVFGAETRSPGHKQLELSVANSP